MESGIPNNTSIGMMIRNDSSVTTTNESIATSTITTESIFNDGALTTYEKKRKLNEIYSNGQWKEEDEHEIYKVKKIVRTNIFKYVKFCKGEGNINIDKNRKHKMKQLVLGIAHDKADLTKRTGYEYEVMKQCGKDDRRMSLTERAMWWKTYNTYVISEIRKQRGAINFRIRKNICEGKMD